VTVTGVNDGLGDGDQSVNIVLSADGFEDVPVGVVNADNDGGPSIDVSGSSGDGSDGCPTPEEEVEEEEEENSLGSVVESSGSTVMSEGGSSDSFTFALASQPGSSVVVSVVSSDLSEASVSVSSLTFSPSNWDVPQSVTVTGVNDGLGDGDQSVNIVLSADGFENVLVGATNIDND